jgi:hypothetical protein
MSEKLLAPVARQRLPDRRTHRVINFSTADGFTYTSGVGYFADGRLAEIFLNTDKIGTTDAPCVSSAVMLAQACPISKEGIHGTHDEAHEGRGGL